MPSSATLENPDAPATTEADEDRDRKVVITLTSGPAAFTRRLAQATGVSIPEVVRRGLTLLDLLVSLGEDEELVIRNRKTREVERIRFQWNVDG